MALNREHAETSRIITAELLRLMNEAADPASGEVQALIERSNGSTPDAAFARGVSRAWSGTHPSPANWSPLAGDSP
jgi:hypothetical protein